MFLFVARLLENVHVRRAGFAFRQEYDVALQRYKMLCAKTWPNWVGMPKEGLKELLKVLYVVHPQATTFIFVKRNRKLISLVSTEVY